MFAVSSEMPMRYPRYSIHYRAYLSHFSYSFVEYGQDKENTTEVTSSMALLFSARVCLVQLNRIDDCRQ